MLRQVADPDAMLRQLAAAGNEVNRAGMARFGISTDRALGVPVPAIRAVARKFNPDHGAASILWQSGIHEARILAALVDRPIWVDAEQMDRWTGEFDSWDVCDQVCGNLWDRTPMAGIKILQWAGDDRQFVRRAAFATLAWMAVHRKDMPDGDLVGFLPLIREAAGDDRNFVRKAVDWALRQLGKRSAFLHGHCLALARELADDANRTARWIGTHARAELTSAAVLTRLARSTVSRGP